ncbi:MAG TPA: UbiD family decarboxylase [Candidatus Binatia bacterium]|nr:UbiD family decarboxylase [Candidatus Binatia bacterium]
MAVAEKVFSASGYHDLRAHIAALEREGLIHHIDQPVNKDTEMHPLVRWQYRGGIPDAERKAFLFTNAVDSQGRKYASPVLIGGLAGSRRIYAIGMQCPESEIGARWERALRSPLPPVVWDGPAPVHEVVIEKDQLEATGGLLNFPQPISTPGYDNAPYLSSAHYITKDPENGTYNAGNYRGMFKGPAKVAVQFSPHGADGAVHWEKYKRRGEHCPVAIVVGGPPVLAYTAVQRMPLGTDEMAVAGALAGAPLRVVKAKTVDLLVPADAECVIEGYMRTDYLEPEGPFGESHGYVHARTMSPVVEITAITHRKDPIWTSFISQVTPSESSTIKIVSYEPMFLSFLRNDCGVKSVVKVSMHEPLTNIRPVIFLQFRNPTDGEVWRGLKLASGFKIGVGKLIIAVDEDIEPTNLDAVMWALAYRMTPHEDVQIVRGYDKGHAPPFREVPAMENSVMLINATLRDELPPISLPKREFMEKSLELWKKLGLPPVTPQSPWYGYSLGDWDDELDAEAALATQSRWIENAIKAAKNRVSADAKLAKGDL